MEQGNEPERNQSLGNEASCEEDVSVENAVVCIPQRLDQLQVEHGDECAPPPPETLPNDGNRGERQFWALGRGPAPRGPPTHRRRDRLTHRLIEGLGFRHEGAGFSD